MLIREARDEIDEIVYICQCMRIDDDEVVEPKILHREGLDEIDDEQVAELDEVEYNHFDLFLILDEYDMFIDDDEVDELDEIDEIVVDVVIDEVDELDSILLWCESIIDDEVVDNERGHRDELALDNENVDDDDI